jgi:uncharacterized protein YjbI with pentapeptide repeats
VNLTAADLAKANLCSAPAPGSAYMLARSARMGVAAGRQEGTSELFALAYLDQFRTRTNLADADLSRANLAGADLRGAVLMRATLAGSVLIGADLTGALLTEADLSGADLRNADFTRANLTGAHLMQAILGEVRLSALNDRSVIARDIGCRARWRRGPRSRAWRQKPRGRTICPCAKVEHEHEREH